MSIDVLQTKCNACEELVHEPYIECFECSASLCTACFASGKEVNDHKNNHKYSVRKNDFSLFENCNWTVKEESKLLSALSTFGYGNWEEISKHVHTRSKLECHEHYKKYYIENVQYKELKLLPETEQSMFPKPLMPYLYNTGASRNPPRNIQGDQYLAGYNAHRSEFEFSYDYAAENIFNIEDDYSDEEDDECMDSLKVALGNALNNRLRERQRRYTIIKNHGLIMRNKVVSWFQRYKDTLTRGKMWRLIPFMQFMTGIQFDAFIESLSLEVELFQRINRLSSYRRNGVRTLHSGRLYRQLKNKNDSVTKEQKHITEVMKNKFEYQLMNERNPWCSGLKKRILTPLEIYDFAGYENLSESEKDLCSNLRLRPKIYLDIKERLIAENEVLGSLRLQEARRIIKIDVNKTRKIYDHLASEGFISIPT